jgi:hypothetical protein
MMFRTVWSEKLVLPAIGLAAQDATQPPLSACAGFWEAPVDAVAGTAAAAPRTSAAPPRTVASSLPRELADRKRFTFAPLAPSSKISEFLHRNHGSYFQPYTDSGGASMAARSLAVTEG